MHLRIKKYKTGYEVNAFNSKNEKSLYTNIIDNDPNKIAQILIDLWINGFKVVEAVKIFNSRMKKKDWIG